MKILPAKKHFEQPEHIVIVCDLAAVQVGSIPSFVPETRSSLSWPPEGSRSWKFSDSEDP